MKWWGFSLWNLFSIGFSLTVHIQELQGDIDLIKHVAEQTEVWRMSEGKTRKHLLFLCQPVKKAFILRKVSTCYNTFSQQLLLPP